jgi:hypothetical protein
VLMLHWFKVFLTIANVDFLLGQTVELSFLVGYIEKYWSVLSATDSILAEYSTLSHGRRWLCIVCLDSNHQPPNRRHSLNAGQQPKENGQDSTVEHKRLCS